MLAIQCVWVLFTLTGIRAKTTTTETSTPKKQFYPHTRSEVDFSKLEKDILVFWEQNNIFQKSVEQRSKENRYVFYDGPPFANGRPHYGHLLTGYLKDTYARYQTMLGRRVERRVGWDCHGLPAEMETEKALNISGKREIERFGIAEFNKRCKDEVLKYVSSWEDYIGRQGRWVDLEGGYYTMNRRYMESVMWAFKQLYLKGLVYESERVVPYSWACQCPLSNFETRLDNSYRLKTSKAMTVAFELLKKPKQLENLAPKCMMLVWTTTPWTLPSNLALAVGNNITYTVVWIQPSYMEKTEHYLYIFAENYRKRFDEICNKKELYTQNIGFEFSSEDLVGLPYKPLFPYFKDTKNAFRVLKSDHVSANEGTGIVHIAPGFGEEDFELCRKHDIPIICPVDGEGRFTEDVSDFNSTHVFDANFAISCYLKKHKNWFLSEDYTHTYPHCWRTDTPLIYRTMPSWYIAVTRIKNKLLELNKNINWVPEHIKQGIFGNWLENVADWSISRNRFWGTPIPIWKSDNPAFPRIDVYGSVDELERDFGKTIVDLHRPFIDTLTRKNPDDPTGKSTMRRIPDIFDCWFDSGSMPFAQFHYPFENKELFEDNFPADFVTEYMAQTRGWFYTTFVLSAALFDKEPFKNVICHGVVLNSKGHKLSKRLDNFIDPAVITVKYGSDALRFLMLSRPVVSGDNLILDKQGKAIEEVVRVVIKPIWNSYNFFTLYANTDNIKAELVSDPNLYNRTIDKYIILKCFLAVQQISQFLDQYNSQDACRIVNDFFDALNNWYIRRNRDRFWKNIKDQEKQTAYNVLNTVFNYILRAAAPVLPFLTETIWRGLKFKEESVHLTDFPQVKAELDNPIIFKMDLTRKICNAAMSIRKASKIRVRQPIRSMKIFHESSGKLFDLMDYIKEIKSETNVREIKLESSFSELADMQLQLKFPVLGKRIPEKVKQIVKLVAENKWKKTDNQQILIGDENEQFLIHPGEYEIKLKPKHKNTCLFDEGRGVVTLDLTFDDELILEGYARDVVRNIQETRKQADLDLTDRIRVVIQTDNPQIKEAINKWSEYIKEQTLAHSLEVNSQVQDMFSRKYSDLTVALRIYHEIT